MNICLTYTQFIQTDEDQEKQAGRGFHNSLNLPNLTSFYNPDHLNHTTMKKHYLHFTVFFAAIIVLASCTKDVKESEEIPQEVISRLADLGFNTSNVQKIDEGYLVEGDIIIPADRLNENPDQVKLRIAEVEQYHTYNLVTGTPREITVSTSGISGALSQAVNDALARYNAQNLQLTFTRVASGGDINIKLVKTRQYIASAGF